MRSKFEDLVMAGSFVRSISEKLPFTVIMEIQNSLYNIKEESYSKFNREDLYGKAISFIHWAVAHKFCEPNKPRWIEWRD